MSKHVNKIFCCPGNAGIAELAECIDISPNDLSAIIDFVKYEWIDLTIVGSEHLLPPGIVNALEREGCRILGPDRTSLHLRSSRVFVKDLLRLYRIPTPEYRVFSSYLHAQDYIRLKGTPIVIKPAGYSGGNGAFIAYSTDAAEDILKRIMKDRIVSDAGRQVIVEEYLKGKRLSFTALTDSRTVIPLTSLKTYFQERAENFMKSETMVAGACSPAPSFTKESESLIMGMIMRPLLKAFASEGINYRGFFSTDLLIDKNGPKVLDLHFCFGDLEAPTILPRIRTDLIKLTMAVLEEQLSDMALEWEQGSSVCVAMYSASGLQEGSVLKGLTPPIAEDNIFTFHENTSFLDAEYVTAGGRAVCITALGIDLQEARSKAYRATERISFEGMMYRNDIGNHSINT